MKIEPAIAGTRVYEAMKPHKIPESRTSSINLTNFSESIVVL